MLGAILGDIVGSPYEFDRNNYKHKDFPLLSEKSHFTDDTVMMIRHFKEHFFNILILKIKSLLRKHSSVQNVMI